MLKRLLKWLQQPIYLIDTSDKVDWIFIIVIVIVTIFIVSLGYSLIGL